MSRAFDKGSLMVALSPVSWRPGLALAATHLPAGETVSLELHLSRRHDYAFIASTNDETSDLDLYLRDSLGNVLTADREPDATPILEFRVERTGNYRLQLHLSGSRTAANWASVALLRSGGETIVENDFRAAIGRFSATKDALEPAHRWVRMPGSWPLQVIVIAEKKGLTFTGIAPGPGTTTWAAAGGPNIRDLTLYLANERGEIIGRSRTSTPFPLLSLSTDGQQVYDLRLESRRQKKPGFLLLGTLKI